MPVRFSPAILIGLALVAGPATVSPCAAQTPAPAAAATPDDTPAIKVGVLLFTDFTSQQQPKIKDADGNLVTLSAFQVSRSYINITGNVSHTVAFRITPDIARETGVGSSLNGSYTFRLKYAYAQWNLDGHLTKGSYARFGMQATPWVEFIDGVYRYRFQGQTFEDREGFLPSADVGASFHYSLPSDYGDVHAAIFNGETYARPEVNDQKSFQIRGSLRPLPTRGALQGLRVTGFWDHDAYVRNAERRRAIVAVTFEHPRVRAGFNYLDVMDQTSAAATLVAGKGWSAFVTPTIAGGWEALLRFDQLQPLKSATDRKKKRTIAGLAYWFPHQERVSSALMLDVDTVTFDGFSPARATERKIAVHALVSF